METYVLTKNQFAARSPSSDSSMRNLNLGELAYGSEKARKLFREMIKKAEAEVGFEAEDIPLMVEAISVCRKHYADHHQIRIPKNWTPGFPGSLLCQKRNHPKPPCQMNCWRARIRF